MEKNPSECKNSFLFDDIYICKLQTVPCSVLNECALKTINTFTESMVALIEAIKEQPKE